MTSIQKRSDKVTVIADIMEYVGEILPHIHRVVDRCGFGFHTSLIPEDIVRWIIAKVYWDVFNYDTYKINLNDMMMLTLYHEVDQQLHGKLAEITLAHIAVLKSFDEFRIIDIQIKGRDLFTFYYGDVCSTFYNLQQWK